jgi:TRAP-type mannitol/chloroaromatic compound transport system permease small subunit
MPIIIAAKKIGYGISYLNERLGHVIAWTIFLMMCLVLMDVIVRYIFNLSITWPFEVNETYLLPLMALTSGGYTLRVGGHVGVDLLYNRFSVRKRAIVDLFTYILFFVFCFVLIKYGWKIAWKELIAGTTIPREPYWPIFPVRFLIPIGASLLALQGLVKFFSNLSIAIKGDCQKKDNSKA